MTKILIDAGHGGKDSGAVSVFGGYKYVEKDLALKIAKKLRNMLVAEGYNPSLTRSDDTFVELSHRRALQAGHDVFVSIHLNAAKTEGACGFETYCGANAPKSKRLAGYVQDAIISCVNYYRKKNKVVKYVVKNRGVKVYNYAVIKNPICPAILVENGFITNGMESALLGNDDFIWTLAFAIKQGILKYLAEDK